MEYVKHFIITYFILICISIIMTIIAIQTFKQKKRRSIFIIAILGLTLFISVIETLLIWTRDRLNPQGTTILAFLGYVTRPGLAVLFILLSNKLSTKRRYYFLFVIPLLINLIICSLAFIPGLEQYTFYYYLDSNNVVSFNGGPLRFTSHIISLLYIIYFVYTSVSKLKAKHFGHGIAIIICSIMVTLSILIESFFNENGEIFLLNTTVGVGVMLYYMFLYIEGSKYDSLTGLFNRSTYYQDCPQMEKDICGVIQFDMNGLKYYNDNFGHEEGDKGLATIADIIERNVTHRMYPYRLGGDEFIVLVINSKEEDITKVVEKIKEELSHSKYSASIGYAYDNSKERKLEDMLKKAELEMYKDKNEYYKKSHIERRKAKLY